MHANRGKPLFQQFVQYWIAALIWIISIALLAGGCGTQQETVYHVGILAGMDFFYASIDGFKTQMTELGYIEGQNIMYDIQQTTFDIAAYKRVLQQFVADQVDLIFVFPTEASLEAKAITHDSNIPLVFAHASIEDTGLIQTMLEPGDNITGVRYPGPEIVLKRFEIMHELFPEARRLWVPYQRDYPSVSHQLAILRPAAIAEGITLIETPAANAAELEAHLQALATPADPGIDAILFLSEPLVVDPTVMAVISHFASEYRLPMGGNITATEGYRSLFSLTTDSFATGKQAALLADKVLTGTPAGMVPAASAETRLQIDYTMAQTIGISVPEGLLYQADEVIR